MGEYKKVHELNPGEKAILIGFEETTGPYRRKLLSMGLTRGVEIEFVKSAPLGDPVEIRMRGYSLSLRKAEADILQLREVRS